MFGWCAPDSDNDGVATFEQLYKAFLKCRKRKRHTQKAQKFEMQLLEHLCALQQQINDFCWQAAAPVSFVCNQPKAREIHAAPFRDRVVHHYLVPKLEALFEPQFIADVYSNRCQKGTHKAVARLQHFMRKQTHNGQKEGYYLQLDIKNFFNSIQRDRLWRLCQQRIVQAQRQQQITLAESKVYQFLCYQLLSNNGAQHSHYVGRASDLAKVPAYKRLVNAPRHCGLPIGNLSSQFFANVYLNPFDQFVKHQLRCRYYLRYVDDFVLLADSLQQLQQWQSQIESYLCNIGLSISRYKLASVYQGIDFLGYVIRPHYRLVRKRVVDNLKQKLYAFEQQYLQAPSVDSGYFSLNVTPLCLERLFAQLNSYLGHCMHAKHFRLMDGVWQQFKWLQWLFSLRIHAGKCVILRRYQVETTQHFPTQWQSFKQHYPHIVLLVQLGHQWVLFNQDVSLYCAARLKGHHLQSMWPLSQHQSHYGMQTCMRFAMKYKQSLVSQLVGRGYAVVCLAQSEQITATIRQRILSSCHWPDSADFYSAMSKTFEQHTYPCSPVANTDDPIINTLGTSIC